MEKCDICSDSFDPKVGFDIRERYVKYTWCLKCIIKTAKEEDYCPYIYQFDGKKVRCTECPFGDRECLEDVFDDANEKVKAETISRTINLVAEYLRRRNEQTNR